MSELRLFARGRLDGLTVAARRHLLERTPADASDVSDLVAGLLAEVRTRGDAALFDMAERFDAVTLPALEVPRSLWAEALGELDDDVREALVRAADNIHRFHAAQIPADLEIEIEPGVRLTRVWTPLPCAGVYAPGGRAAYPSSVLMGVVPAKACGVPLVVVCSPAGPSGLPPAEVLAACEIAEADRLFAIGGAGAVAALAYGTETIPQVDTIVGPGNRWVTEAKRQVAGDVVIDAPAGPSEVLVLADDDADPEFVARELMAQAEHDPDAACVLVTTSERLALAVQAEVLRQLVEAPRAEVAATALAVSGAILVAEDLEEAIQFAIEYAPEHLSIMTAGADTIARQITTAGTTFVGPWASVAFGDYMTGGNHVLPTGGRARSFSGLSSQNFLRGFTIQEIDAHGAASMADDVRLLADAEGLPAHAAAAMARKPR